MLIWSMAGYAVHQMDRIVVGLLLPMIAVGTYDIGASLVDFSRNVLNSWLSTILPAAANANTRKASNELRSLFLSGSRYVMLTYGAFLGPTLVLGSSFLSLWMGRPLPGAATVLAVLLIANTFQSQNVVGHVMLPATGHLRFFGRFMATYAVVVISCQFVGGMIAGFVGVAAGTAIAIFVLETWLASQLWRRFEVAADEVVRSVYIPALVPAAVSVIALLVSSRLLSPTHWLGLAASVGVGVASHLAAAWTVGLTPQERASLRQWTLPVTPAVRAYEPSSV